jgi:deferrochelatase/peroxidase EfeB
LTGPDRTGRPEETVGGRSTRRGFLAGAGAALGATALPEAQAAAGSARYRADAVPFHGSHQAGISTPAQEHLQFGAFDVVSDSVDDLRRLLRSWSRAASLIATGEVIGEFRQADRPPVDTGEAVGLGPSRVTVTFGLGPGIFGRRFGLAGSRPAPLIKLPRFSHDALQPRFSGGDLAVQVCADDPQVAFHALHDLTRLAHGVARPRWVLAGFGRTGNTSQAPTPRNLMGFKDGTANIVGEDAAALRQFVWASERESPRWMHGGSYMVVRRIRISLGRWDARTLHDQEAAVGRHKLSGAPLSGQHEHDPINLGAQRRGSLVIPFDAHIRLASQGYNGGQRILRRGYSYVDGIDDRSPAAGLLFICYQRDPRAQFVPIQRRLSLDALNHFTQHVGSAIFACPPGARAGGYVGEGLLG